MIHRTTLSRLSCLTLALVGCGARTPLDTGARADAAVDAVDSAVGAADVPDCGPPLAPGTVRFRVPSVAGHVAIGPDGTIFAPYVTSARGRGVLAVDACGRERWRVPAVEPMRGGSVRGGEVRG